MRRRQYLALSGTTLTVSIAGCTDILSSSDGQNSPAESAPTDSGAQSNADETPTKTTTGPAVLGSESDPWTGTLVDVRTENPGALHRNFDATVSLILTGSTSHTVFIQSDDTDAVTNTAQEAGLEVVGATSSKWTGEPICEARSRTRIPADPSKDDIHDAFTDVIGITKIEVSTGSYWGIYSRTSDSDALSNRVEDLSGDTSGAVIQTYSGCIRPET
jgi:hypothetical protein